MNAIVVYESLWGNTAAVARAIAEGLGGSARAYSTAEASPSIVAAADLIVAGAPVFGFRLGDDAIRENIQRTERKKPDLSNPSLRSWLEKLAPGKARFAAFETGLWWSPGGSTKTIASMLSAGGYSPLNDGKRRFVVKGRYGPLRDGELDKARQWGAELAKALS